MPRAVPSLHRAWDDPVGSETVLHREPFQQDPGALVAPGTSPRGQQLVSQYKEYTRLDDWEALNQGLNKEAVPVKRHTLSDYLSPKEVPYCEPVPGSKGPVETPAAPQPVTPGWSASRESSTQVAGRMCVGLPSPLPSAAAAAAASGTGLEVQQVPEAPPTVPLTRAALAAHCSPGDRPTGAARVESEQARRRVCRPGTDPDISPKIRTVQAGQMAISPRRHGARHSTAPRISDKERALYPNAKDMRASRKVNLESKRRLNELLTGPGPRIEATDCHASRTFGVVPSQNVRVS